MKRKPKSFPALCGPLAILLVVMAGPGAAGESLAQSRKALNPEGVLAILAVMDVVADSHPDFETRAKDYARLEESVRESTFAAIRSRNEANDELSSAINLMLETTTYKTYFQRFSNVDADMMRDLILDLPYRARPAPGGIGRMLYDLVRKRNAVRAGLDKLLHEVDMDWVHETARLWAPEDDREAPPMYLIYDSNAGSFTAMGTPFFNLYGTDLEALGSEPDGRGVNEIQAVMAHELQHVLARSYLYVKSGADGPWQRRWADRITRGLVSEGVAIHCNPPNGLKKEIYEDRAVVAALISRLNGALIAMSEDSVAEDEMQAWNRANYFEVAEDLLRRHLETRCSGDELEASLRENMPLRPDLEHALGWWMVSRISAEGKRREAAVALISTPHLLYSQYNDSLAPEDEALKIADNAMLYLETLYESSAD